MKVHLSTALKTIGGKSILQSEKEGEKPQKMTVRDALTFALEYAPVKGEGTLEEKLKRYAIAKRIQRSKGETVDLTAEEATTCKAAAAEVFNVSVLGPLADALEGIKL